MLSDWKTLNITSNCDEILWMSIALPLAPSLDFEEGLLIIQKEADKLASTTPQINSFMTLIRTKWSPLSDSVNSFYCNERTNPFEETFYNFLLSQLQRVKSLTIEAYFSKRLS